MSSIDRRQLFCGLVASAFIANTAQAETRPAVFDLPVAGRTLKVTHWEVAQPKAVILFSHGAGSWPERYEKLIGALTAQGYAVLAPLHGESMKVPEAERRSLQAVFGERIADMATLAGYAQQHYPGLPLIAGGHSYGTLFALMLGGALTYVADIRNPAVKAVFGFSSPGAIPNLINPIAYTSVKVPSLIITGEKDVVPGFVTDWHDHLLPFKGTPVTGSYALVIKAGLHDLVGGANSETYDVAQAVVQDFLARTVSGETSQPLTLSAKWAEKAELLTK